MTVHRSGGTSHGDCFPAARVSDASGHPLRCTLRNARALLDHLALARHVSDCARARLVEEGKTLAELCDQIADARCFVDVSTWLRGVALARPAYRPDPDVISLDGGEVAMLRDELILVDRLLRWGAMPNRAMSFEADGLYYCGQLGKDVRSSAPLLRQFCVSLSRGETTVSADWPKPGPGLLRRALRRLEGYLLLAAFTLHRDGPMAPDGFLRAVVQVADDPQARYLLKGAWLAGFAQAELKDLARRRGGCGRMLANLEVELPPRVGGVAVYDLIAQVEVNNRVHHLVFACKPGRLAAIDVDAFVASRDALARAAAAEGDGLQLTSICLTTGVVTPDDESAEPRLRERLSDAGIALVSTAELSAHLEHLFA